MTAAALIIALVALVLSIAALVLGYLAADGVAGIVRKLTDHDQS